MEHIMAKASHLIWLGYASVIVLALPSSHSLATGLPIATPAEVGMDAERLEKIAPLVDRGIQDGDMPGCVICIGRHGKIVYLQAFGNRQLEPDLEPMTTDTIFDLASLTKPVATATSVMKLLEDGRLRLDDKVVTFLPEFAPHGKDEIAIRDLLIHQSGLIPDNSLRDYEHGSEKAWKNICELDLSSPVRTKFKYSDLNFIVLGELVKRLSGKSLHAFSRDSLFQPLGMKETGFLPNEEMKQRCAPTQQRDGHWMRGEVHDPRAHLLGGVAGHAGLFSSAHDLAIYAQMMLGKGTYRPHDREPVVIMSPRTVATMTAAYPVSDGLRGLGWDKQTGFSSNKGDLLTVAAYGHGGFTGTVLWIDPELDLFLIFLSNRVHPIGAGSVNHLAGRIVNVAASSIAASSIAASSIADEPWSIGK